VTSRNSPSGTTNVRLDHNNPQTLGKAHSKHRRMPAPSGSVLHSICRIRAKHFTLSCRQPFSFTNVAHHCKESLMTEEIDDRREPICRQHVAAKGWSLGTR